MRQFRQGATSESMCHLGGVAQGTAHLVRTPFSLRGAGPVGAGLVGLLVAAVAAALRQTRVRCGLRRGGAAAECGRRRGQGLAAHEARTRAPPPPQSRGPGWGRIARGAQASDVQSRRTR